MKTIREKIFGNPIKAIKAYEASRNRLKHLKIHLDRYKDIDSSGMWGSGSYDFGITNVKSLTIINVCTVFALRNRKYTILLNDKTNNIEIHKSKKTINSSRNEYRGYITEISAMNTHPIDVLIILVWAFLRRAFHYGLIGLATGAAISLLWFLGFPGCFFN